MQGRTEDVYFYSFDAGPKYTRVDQFWLLIMRCIDIITFIKYSETSTSGNPTCINEINVLLIFDIPERPFQKAIIGKTIVLGYCPVTVFFTFGVIGTFPRLKNNWDT